MVAPLVFGAVAGSALGLAGSAMGASAQRDAARQQAQAAADATAEQRRQFDTQVALQAPTYALGVASQDAYAHEMGLAGRPGTANALSRIASSYMPSGMGGGGGAIAGGGGLGTIQDAITRVPAPPPAASRGAGPPVRVVGRGELEVNGQIFYDRASAERYAATFNAGQTGQSRAPTWRFGDREYGTWQEAADAYGAASQRIDTTRRESMPGGGYQGIQGSAYGRFAGGLTEPQRAMPDTSLEAFEASPGYQFRQDEARRAIENSGAGRGITGNTLAALQERSQGLASDEFGNWFNRTVGLNDIKYGRDVDQFNRKLGVRQTYMDALSGRAGQGANSLSILSQSFGSQAAANTLAAGQARANSTIGQANTWNNALGGLANTAGQLVGSGAFSSPAPATSAFTQPMPSAIQPNALSFGQTANTPLTLSL